MTAPTTVRVIAEAAQGFEGDPRLARLLVRAAARGGADLVKFQLVFADELATPDYDYYGLFKTLEMRDEAWRAIAAEAKQHGLDLAFDIFGERSLDLAIAVGAAAVKLHSTDFFNRRLVRAAVASAPHVYLSIGGIAYDQVARTIDACDAPDRLTILFGFQGEPTPVEQNHLSRLGALRARFPGIRFGFMDHADGGADEAGWLGILALPYGVSVIEKHITLDRAVELEDWVSALDASAFARYVARIRTAERALGSPVCELSEAEEAYGRRAVKVLVASRPIAPGAVIADADLVALRAPVPDGRTVLRDLEAATGRRARTTIPQGQPVCEEDLA
jgi:sialic acid synthase SpsE